VPRNAIRGVDPDRTGENRTDGSLQPELLDVNDVARLLNCSPRTVCRLADAGRIPRPVKLGRLSRWPSQAIEQWIADGCPACERARARR
jgi:excisionase family DNA binding protein